MRPIDSNVLALAQAIQSSAAMLFRFEIVQIDGAAWNYTSLQHTLVVNGEGYTPAAITLESGSAVAGDGDAQTFAVRAPRVEPFISFVGKRFPFQLICKVMRVYIDGDGTPHADLVHRGELIKAERTMTSVKADFKPYVPYFDRKIPAVLFSRLDQRIPYAAGFVPNNSAFAVSTVASLVTGNVVVCAEAGAKADGYYANGVIEYVRSIDGKDVTLRVPVRNNESGTLVLGYPAPMLSSGEPFIVYAGYDGSWHQAANKFSNSAGVIMFPHMPFSNPAIVPSLTCQPTVCGQNNNDDDDFGGFPGGPHIP